LDCDYFIVPVAADLFSLRALKTLGRSLVEWIQGWSTISALAPEDLPLLRGRPAFLGYVPEGFKVYGGVPTSEHAKFLGRIDREIRDQVVALLRDVGSDLVVGRSPFKLGEVKHFGALVPSAQQLGWPLYYAEAGSSEQREQARKALFALARKFDAKIQGRTAKG
jgi:hypothetical protein